MKKIIAMNKLIRFIRQHRWVGYASFRITTTSETIIISSDDTDRQLRLNGFNLNKQASLPKTTDESINLDLLKSRRESLNMSLRDVEKNTKISASTLSRIENGHDCYYNTIVKLDKFYKQQGV